jgi:uncharacterized membrane protein
VNDDDEPDLGRFGTLSDGIFAVAITIMVLALRPPDQYDLHALLGLWPDATSYAVSYLFIAVVWLNHHHVFRYGRQLTTVLAWSNFANLFTISLIPSPRRGWPRAGSPPSLSRCIRRYSSWSN